MKTFLVGLGSLFASNLLSLGLNFVFTIILIQKLSPVEYGLQSALVALTGIAMSLANLGTFDVTAREFTRQKPEALADNFNSVLSLRLALSGLICVAVTIIVLIPNSFPGDQFIVYLLALFTLVFSFAPTSTAEALFSAVGRTHTIALFQAIYNVGTTVLGALILLAGLKLAALYLALSILSFLLIVLYLRVARSILGEPLRLVFRPREWRRLLSQTVAGGVGGTLVTFCLRFGTYWVYTFFSQERAGYIGLGSQLYQALIVLIWAPFVISILPILTRLHAQAPDQLRWLGSRSITWLMIAVLPITLGAVLLAPDLLDVLKHGAGLTVTPVFRILIWLLPLDILQSFSYRMLLVTNQQNRYLWAAVVAAITNFVLCLVLIPMYDVQGAALASMISLGILAAISLWRLRDWLLPQLRLADVLRVGAALIAMTVIVQLTASSFFGLRILVGGLAYGGVLLILNVFPRHDLTTTRHLMQVAQASVAGRTR